MEMGFAGDIRSNRVDVTAIRLGRPLWGALFRKEREHNIYYRNPST
jgi:hypothetical protein